MKQFPPWCLAPGAEACQAVPGTDLAHSVPGTGAGIAWRLLALAIIGKHLLPAAVHLGPVGDERVEQRADHRLHAGVRRADDRGARSGADPSATLDRCPALPPPASYLVVGRGNPGAGDSIAGDILMRSARSACWALGTIVAKPLLGRWPAFEITGLSMALGTIM